MHKPALSDQFLAQGKDAALGDDFAFYLELRDDPDQVGGQAGR